MSNIDNGTGNGSTRQAPRAFDWVSSECRAARNINAGSCFASLIAIVAIVLPYLKFITLASLEPGRSPVTGAALSISVRSLKPARLILPCVKAATCASDEKRSMMAPCREQF